MRDSRKGLASEGSACFLRIPGKGRDCLFSRSHYARIFPTASARCAADATVVEAPAVFTARGDHGAAPPEGKACYSSACGGTVKISPAGCEHVVHGAARYRGRRGTGAKRNGSPMHPASIRDASASSTNSRPEGFERRPGISLASGCHSSSFCSFYY